MMVQMEQFLGDGGTGKRQYTAEPKSYSVVVKKPVCNVIPNSSLRDRSVILMARGRAPLCASGTTPHSPTTTYLPRRLEN
jgi:hypothetical protein